MKSTTVEDCKILIGTFLIHCLIGGSSRLAPILFVESIAYYNVDRNQASFPFVLSYVLRNLSGPLIGYLEQIFGIRWLVLSGCVTGAISIAACAFSSSILTFKILWGVIFGASFGFTCNMLPVLLNDHFPKHQSKANSIFFAGSSVGSLVVPVIFEIYLNRYGMSGSFLLLSALVAHCIPAALLLDSFMKKSSTANVQKFKEETSDLNRNLNPIYVIELKEKQELLNSKPNNLSYNGIKSSINHEIYEKEEKNGNFSLKNSEEIKSSSFENFDIFINPAFIGILIVSAFVTLMIVTYWTIILDMIRDKGIDKSVEMHFIICLPVSELSGRFISGYVFDKSPWSNSSMYLICSICISLSLIMFNFVSSYALLLVFEALVSFFIAGVMLLQVAFVSEFIEKKKKVMAMSCRHTLFAPCTFAISPMIGYFRGHSGSYDSIVYILSVLCFLSGCTAFILPYISRKKANK